MSINSKEDDPIIIENFNPKNYFNDNDLKKIKDKKLKITNVGKYSITKPIHTSWIKSILINFFKSKNISTKSLNIIDCTAGIGGDTISFSKYFNLVLAVEKNKTHFDILKNNVEVLELENVILENNDFVKKVNKVKTNKKYDLLFIDPPWGGPNYKNLKNVDLFIHDDKDNKILLKDIINSYYDDFNYIILKSPKNLNLVKEDYLFKNIHTTLDKDNKILLIIFEK